MVRTRLAPSPTGDPHIGTAYQALFDLAYARQNNGKFILRIEDTDRERFNPTSQGRLLSAFKWLGIVPDEGPGIGGTFGPYVQTERLEIYKEHIDKLIKQEDAYYCFCSKERLETMRKEQEKAHLQPKYDRFCLKLTKEEIDEKLKKGESYVVRMKIPENETITFTDLIRGDISIHTNQIDDQVILKSDGIPTYHLAVVVDDHLMEISHVIRGEEWISSTPKHILLYRMFGWELPKFAHLPLLRNPDKSKMSKRKNDTSLENYRAKGYLPDAFKNFLVIQAWSHPEGKDIFTFDEFISKFDFKRFSTTGPTFDTRKLDWMNGVYIRNTDINVLAELVKPYLTDFNLKSDEYYISALKLIQERMKRLEEAPELLQFFFKDIPSQDFSDQEKNILNDIFKLVENAAVFDHESLEQPIRDIADKNSQKAGDVFMLLRLAVTGNKASPPLFETMTVLGKVEVIKRIKANL